jgi:hypothetical protein
VLRRALTSSPLVDKYNKSRNTQMKVEEVEMPKFGVARVFLD